MKVASVVANVTWPYCFGDGNKKPSSTSLWNITYSPHILML